MIIRQGDEYSYPATITIDGVPINIEEVEIAEFIFGDVVKFYGTIGEGASAIVGTVTYDTDHFIVPLTQEETFSLDAKKIEYQARVKLIGGEIRGTCIRKGNVYESLSQTIL